MYRLQFVNRQSLYLESKFPLIDGPNAIYYFRGETCIECMIRHDKETNSECVVSNKIMYLEDYQSFIYDNNVYMLALGENNLLIVYLLVEKLVSPTLYQADWEIHNPNSKSKYAFLNSPPSYRTKYAACVIKDHLIVYGGEGCSQDQHVYCYSFKHRLWISQNCSQNIPWLYGQQMLQVAENKVIMRDGHTYEGKIKMQYSIEFINNNYIEEIDQQMEQNKYCRVTLVRCSVVPPKDKFKLPKDIVKVNEFYIRQLPNQLELFQQDGTKDPIFVFNYQRFTEQMHKYATHEIELGHIFSFGIQYLLLLTSEYLYKFEFY